MERTETTEAIIKDGNFTLEKDVGIFEHFLSDDECDSFIELYRNQERNGLSINRQDFEGVDAELKSDSSVIISYGAVLYGKLEEMTNSFQDKVWESVKCYGKYYPSLLKINKSMYGFKIQKTIPGEGYHLWHCENLGDRNTTRVLSYILYLNDDFTGGETEFLQKNLRSSPKKGSLLIFPTNYTHTHRGNPPLTGEKYIMAGWIHQIGNL